MTRAVRRVLERRATYNAIHFDLRQIPYRVFHLRLAHKYPQSFRHREATECLEGAQAGFGQVEGANDEVCLVEVVARVRRNLKPGLVQDLEDFLSCKAR